VSFSSEVANAFGFLVSDYGFRFADPPDFSAGELVEYRKEPVTISFGWYKGEIDVNFRVSLEFAAAHKIFRPYLSRTFQLREIAVWQDRNAFAFWATRRDLGGFVLRSEQAAPYLDACAAIMRQYCIPVLSGDLTLLEKITMERKADADRKSPPCGKPSQ
jgi:hypothetical protein